MDIYQYNRFHNIKSMLKYLHILNQIQIHRHDIISPLFRNVISFLLESRTYTSDTDNIIALSTLTHLGLVNFITIRNSTCKVAKSTESGTKIFSKLDQNQNHLKDYITYHGFLKDMWKNFKIDIGVAIGSMILCAFILGFFIFMVHCNDRKGIMGLLMLASFALAIAGGTLLPSLSITIFLGVYSGTKDIRYKNTAKELLKKNYTALPTEDIMAQFLLRHNLIIKNLDHIDRKDIEILSHKLFDAT